MDSAEENGVLIVFEGIDKSGKDTQVRKLVKDMHSVGCMIVSGGEPTNGAVGQQIREILNGKRPPIEPMELQKLFVEDRREHQSVLRFHRKKGQPYLCIRYLFSTIAYGMTEGLTKEELMDMQKEFILPDLTVFLDISPELAMQRMALAGDQPEYFEKKEKLEQVRAAYKEIFKEVKNLIVIDGSRSEEEVFEEIRSKIQKWDFKH